VGEATPTPEGGKQYCVLALEVLNVGKSEAIWQGGDYGIFQIPADDDPTTVWVASGTSLESFDGAEPGYLVQLAPTD